MLQNLNQEEILSLKLLKKCIFLMGYQIFSEQWHYGKVREECEYLEMAAFFENGFTEELLEYESCLEQRFNFPAIGICAYDSKDIDIMTLEQIRQLQEHHNPVWMKKINST
jgi:hypothetical protein